MYVNDLPEVVTHVSPYMYADDLQLIACSLMSIADLNQCVSNINEDLSIIHQWSISNSLVLNPLKSQALAVRGNRVVDINLVSFKIGDQYIPVVCKLKCLGFILNERLQFDDHIDSVC